MNIVDWGAFVSGASVLWIFLILLSFILGTLLEAQAWGVPIERLGKLLKYFGAYAGVFTVVICLAALLYLAFDLVMIGFGH